MTLIIGLIAGGVLGFLAFAIFSAVPRDEPGQP